MTSWQLESKGGKGALNAQDLQFGTIKDARQDKARVLKKMHNNYKIRRVTLYKNPEWVLQYTCSIERVLKYTCGVIADQVLNSKGTVCCT